MNPSDQLKVQRLFEELRDLEERRRALVDEAQELAARLPDIRAAFGNPFFYSHPEHRDESVANYTGGSSHDVVLPTILAVREVGRDIVRVKTRLRELGANVE